MKRVSEIITTQEIKKWKRNNIITITAGTGVGKSYFIKNILYAFAKKKKKKILMLIHRTNCVNQFKAEIKRDNKQDVIHIKTYQSIENKEINFKEYYYIICDEFHYFMSDASFNITTDISLNKVLEQKNKVKIFMSATGNYVQKYLNNIKKYETIDYEIPIEFNFIKHLSFFNKMQTLEEFIKECIEKKDKAIFFIQSAKEAYQLYNKYKEYSLFNCSKSNTKYYKYVDEEKINNMLVNERFEENILFTTSCMDAGVNIIDKELHHIVCDIKDLGTLIQCIGRKRIQSDNDYVNIYIKSLTNNQLGGMKTQLSKRIEKAEFLKGHTVKEYILKYPRQNDYSNIVYDETVKEENKGKKKINELMYFKNLIDISIIDIMLLKKNKYAYNKYIVDLLGKNFDEVRILEESYKADTLENYLNDMIGKKIFKEDQHELIEKISLKVDGKIQKSYSKLNEGLKMINLPFIIIPKKSNDKRYWIIDKIEF